MRGEEPFKGTKSWPFTHPNLPSAALGCWNSKVFQDLSPLPLPKHCRPLPPPKLWAPRARTASLQVRPFPFLPHLAFQQFHPGGDPPPKAPFPSASATASWPLLVTPRWLPGHTSHHVDTEAGDVPKPWFFSCCDAGNVPTCWDAWDYRKMVDPRGFMPKVAAVDQQPHHTSLRSLGGPHLSCPSASTYRRSP